LRGWEVEAGVIWGLTYQMIVKLMKTIER
jgi:hypothetical protein